MEASSFLQPPGLHAALWSRASSHSLLPSPSPSIEADDELSASSAADMGPDFVQPRGPRYPGEDTRVTSSKEVTGWYFYGWAAEVFIVCAMGSFLPITLEQLARENGVLLSDLKTPCSTGLDPNHPIKSAGHTKPQHAPKCVVDIFGTRVNTASFAMYTFSISVLVQSLLIISMSGAADHGRFRKSLLLCFAFTGAVATMLFLPMVPKIYLVAALLAIIANTCVGASFVLLNSFLPLIVRHHPSVQYLALATAAAEREDDESNDDSDASSRDLVDSRAALIAPAPSDELDSSTKPLPMASPELQLSTKISSNGIGIGYIAAVIVQILSTFIVILLHGSTFSLRLVLFLIGAWWFCFTIPAALFLRPRPGPPLATKSPNSSNPLPYLLSAWRSLGRTILRARRLRDITFFLLAWFLLSDGIATVSGTAVLFAKTTLSMSPGALALINVVVMASGVLGAFSWARLSARLRLTPLRTILACLLVFELIPLYALLGYLPPVQRLGVLGLQQPWEMYALGAVYGLVMGGLSSYCRALYGELIPPGFEAAFYALYAVTDKGSSVFGPAVVGLVVDWTGEIRPAFWFLAVLIGAPVFLLVRVDVERGRREGRALVGELEAVVEGGAVVDEHGLAGEG